MSYSMSSTKNRAYCQLRFQPKVAGVGGIVTFWKLAHRVQEGI